MRKTFLLPILVLISTGITFSQSTTWKLDNLKKIGGHRIEILGQP